MRVLHALDVASELLDESRAGGHTPEVELPPSEGASEKPEVATEGARALPGSLPGPLKTLQGKARVTEATFIGTGCVAVTWQRSCA